MNDLAQLECQKLGCVFLTLTDIIIAIRQLYGTSKIVTRLLGQLKVDAGMANQEWRPTFLKDGNLRRLYRRYSFRLAAASARQIVGLLGLFVSDFLIKIFYYNNF